MPKKKKQESPDEQSRRFLEAAQKLVDAGDLDPIKAEKELDRVVKRASLAAHERRDG